MNTRTKEEFIAQLRAIRNRGWIKNLRPGNDGGVGNTLEELLGIKENNLPIPNAAEWELKCQRIGTSSLTTLIHMEPSPRALKFVPSILLMSYGWPHKKAGTKYPETEMSFRQTINALSRTNRGFGLYIDREQRRIVVTFAANAVDSSHSAWLASVRERIGLDELNPQPYWGFDDLFHRAGTKLLNCFYVQAEVKKEGNAEYYRYSLIHMLQNFSLESLIKAIENGFLLVDFDARTGHNHGTKFRLRKNKLDVFYRDKTEIT